MKSKILVWLCLGLVFGAFLHFTCHIGMEKKDVPNTVKDRIVYMNVDELRIKARNGDKQAYKYLKEYFQRKGHSEEIFYYAMVMSDKYHDYTACNDVCSSLRIAFEKYRLGEYDAETKQIISYYQFLSDSIKVRNNLD